MEFDISLFLIFIFVIIDVVKHFQVFIDYLRSIFVYCLFIYFAHFSNGIFSLFLNDL